MTSQRGLCTPQKMLCEEGRAQLNSDLLQKLNACGVKCLGELATQSRRSFGCGALGAIMDEHMRQLMFEYHQRPPSFEEGQGFALSVLRGDVSPEQAFANLAREALEGPA